MKKHDLYAYEEYMKKSQLQLAEVTVSNDLIRAKNRMKKGELKLFHAVISQVNPFKKNGNIIKLNKAELFDLLELKSNDKYTRWLKPVKNLIKETIVDFCMPNGEYFVGAMITSVESNKHDFVFTINPKIMPELEKLEERQYSSWILKNTLTLSSVYAIKLYTMLNSWADKGTWAVYEKNLREYFNCEEKYSRKQDFERRTIIPACKEINEKTNMSVVWTPVKKSNCTIGWAFDFSINEDNRDQRDRIEFEEIRDKDLNKIDQARLPF